MNMFQREPACGPGEDADVRRALEESGWRYTRQRAAVLAYLRTAHGHPTAEQVFTAVRQHIPNISLATVYKALEALVDAQSGQPHRRRSRIRRATMAAASRTIISAASTAARSSICRCPTMPLYSINSIHNWWTCFAGKALRSPGIVWNWLADLSARSDKHPAANAAGSPANGDFLVSFFRQAIFGQQNGHPSLDDARSF